MNYKNIKKINQSSFLCYGFFCIFDKNYVMKKLLIVFLLLISFESKSQNFPFGYGTGLRFGCGNDLDLTFTGTTFVVGGVATYYYGVYNNPYLYNTQMSNNQSIQIQNIGITIAITGVIILIEESIRHSSHRR